MNSFIRTLQHPRAVEWVLRVAVAGEFIGHSMFALQGKAGWFKYFYPFGITDEQTILSFLFIIGLFDIVAALVVLFKPIRAVLVWMVFWGFWTALVRWPFGPDPIWDFVERFANWGAPLALLLILGFPKSFNARIGKDR